MSQTASETTQTKTEEASPKVEVAQGTLPAEAAKPASSKVELDIEDAPFLKETPKPPEPKESAEETEESAEENADAGKKKKKKKLLLIAGAAGVLLIVGACAAWFLLQGSPETPPPPPEDTALKPEVIVVPSKPTVAATADIVKNFDRFIVPVGETVATTNFLVCKFATVTKNPALEAELEQKMQTLRDAVYFYLRSKSYNYLLDPNNTTEVKKDLVSIVNDYLTVGKLEDVLLDTYLGH